MYALLAIFIDGILVSAENVLKSISSLFTYRFPLVYIWAGKEFTQNSNCPGAL